MGFFLKIGSPMYFFNKMQVCSIYLFIRIIMLCPIYVFPSNHIIYIYIITIIVYFIETCIYIIKTSHMLLTYKSKCLTEVGKENPGCF